MPCCLCSAARQQKKSAQTPPHRGPIPRRLKARSVFPETAAENERLKVKKGRSDGFSIYSLIKQSLIMVDNDHINGDSWWSCNLINGFNLPLWKIMEWKSVGIVRFPIYGKIIHMFQTTKQIFHLIDGNIPTKYGQKYGTFMYLQFRYLKWPLI